MGKFVKIADIDKIERIVNVDCIEQLVFPNETCPYSHLFLKSNDSVIRINKETCDFLESYFDVNGSLV